MALIDELKERVTAADQLISEIDEDIRDSEEHRERVVIGRIDLLNAIAALEPAPVTFAAEQATAREQLEREPEIPAGFTKWEGGVAPFVGAVRVEFFCRNGEGPLEAQHDHLRWDHADEEDDIIAYRIIEDAPQPEQPFTAQDFDTITIVEDPALTQDVIDALQDEIDEASEGGDWDDTGEPEFINPEHISILTGDPAIEPESGLHWEGWLTWSGGECPVDQSAVVEYQLRGADSPPLDPKPAFLIRWDHAGVLGDIVAYRVVSQPTEYDDPTADAIAAYIEAESAEHPEAPALNADMHDDREQPVQTEPETFKKESWLF